MSRLILPRLTDQIRLHGERAVAQSANISRGTLRNIRSGEGDPRLSSIEAVAERLGLELKVIASPRESASSDLSTGVVSLRIVHNGFESWKIHLMNLIDEFRRTHDPELLTLAPVSELDPKLRALMASICCTLADEASIPPPRWAAKTYFLPKPWFPSEMQSLKAMMIRESPLSFRRNNIFVGENFMRRV